MFKPDDAHSMSDSRAVWQGSGVGPAGVPTKKDVTIFQPNRGYTNVERAAAHVQ